MSAVVPTSLRWQSVQRLLRVIVFTSLTLLGALAVDGCLRAGDQDQIAGQWMHRLDLACPSLWPAGTPARIPDAAPASVDLRLSPFDGWGGTGRVSKQPRIP